MLTFLFFFIFELQVLIFYVLYALCLYFDVLAFLGLLLSSSMAAMA
jgi:hypothetical protein